MLTVSGTSTEDWVRATLHVLLPYSRAPMAADLLDHDLLDHDLLDHNLLDHDLLDHNLLEHDLLDHDLLDHDRSAMGTALPGDCQVADVHMRGGGLLAFTPYVVAAVSQRAGMAPAGLPLEQVSCAAAGPAAGLPGWARPAQPGPRLAICAACLGCARAPHPLHK